MMEKRCGHVSLYWIFFWLSKNPWSQHFVFLKISQFSEITNSVRGYELPDEARITNPMRKNLKRSFSKFLKVFSIKNLVFFFSFRTQQPGTTDLSTKLLGKPSGNLPGSGGACTPVTRVPVPNKIVLTSSSAHLAGGLPSDSEESVIDPGRITPYIR